MGEMLENFQPFLGWLIKTSIQSSVIICLILIIRFLLHKKIAVRWLYILWLLLLVRMILPSLPQTKFSPANYVPETARQVYSESVKQPQAEEVKLPLTAELPIYSSAVSTHQERLSVWSGLNYWNIFAGIWLTGLVFWGLYLIDSNYRLYRSISRQRPLIDERILNLFEDCKTIMGVNTIVGIVAVDNISSPALFGFVRPRLLLPKQLLSDFSMQYLKYVFLHELAHLKRNDILISWITSILQIMHWFNPLVWFAFAKMRVDRELACDSLVLSYIKQERSGEYGQSIVNLLEKFSKQRYMPSMAGILEEKHQMKRRIKMIAEFKSKTAKFSILAAIVLSVFAFVAFTSAQEGLENKTPSDNYEQLGRGFLKLLIDEKYDDAVKDFDATVSQQMPAATLKQTWQQILSQAGKFQKELGIRQQQFLASKIVLLTCQFEKGPLDVKVVYDAEKKISGLWFLPTPEDVLKEYNKKAKQLFDEKEKQAYQVSADFSATLPNGTTVELIGVCEQPDKQWWKPDGSLSSEALMDKTNVSIGPEKANYVVVKIDGYDKADVIGFRYSIDGAQNSGSGCVYKNGQSLDGFYAVVFGNPNGDKKTNIRLGIATGKWETLMSQKADFSGVYSNKDITWHGPIDNNGKTVLHVAHKFEELNVRIVAVDKNGKEFIGGGGSGSKNGVESMQVTFDVPVSDIKEFRFQTRPYEWVEFKNVALKPNKNLSCKIEGPDSLYFKSKSARIVDTQGNPIVGAKIEFSNKITQSNDINQPRGKEIQWQGGSTITDSKGRFPMPKLPVPEDTRYAYYYAKISAPGFLTRDNVELGGNYADDKGEIDLLRPNTIEGVILDMNGLPLPEAAISIRTHLAYKTPGESCSGCYDDEVKSDNQGYFRFGNVPPGYHFLVYPGNRNCNTVHPVKACTGLEVIVKENQNVEGLILDLSKSTAILTGKILDENGEPVEGVYVYLEKEYKLYRDEKNWSGGAHNLYSAQKQLTSTSGEYVIENLPSGQYIARASYPYAKGFDRQPGEPVNIELRSNNITYQDFTIKRQGLPKDI